MYYMCAHSLHCIQDINSYDDENSLIVEDKIIGPSVGMQWVVMLYKLEEFHVLKMRAWMADDDLNEALRNTFLGD